MSHTTRLQGSPLTWSSSLEKWLGLQTFGICRRSGWSEISFYINLGEPEVLWHGLYGLRMFLHVFKQLERHVRRTLLGLHRNNSWIFIPLWRQNSTYTCSIICFVVQHWCTKVKSKIYTYVFEYLNKMKSRKCTLLTIP